MNYKIVYHDFIQRGFAAINLDIICLKCSVIFKVSISLSKLGYKTSATVIHIFDQH